MPPQFSVIIPAYNEELRIGDSLRRILEYFDEQNVSFELIVVDDGSTDRTVAVSEDVFCSRVNCRVARQKRNCGKGAAVRRGIEESIGELILFSDADLSTPIEELSRLRNALQEGADIAIGSRALPNSEVEIHQPWYREYMGKAFNLLVRSILWLPNPDTQCGFKCFKKQVAKRLAKLQHIDGWAFDAELLFLAKKLGYHVADVPVRWINDPGSKVGIFSSSSQMLWDVLKVRLRSLTGCQDKNNG